MPNVAKVLKDEIARISKKVAKAVVAPVRKPSARHRKDIADLKRRMASMEKAARETQALLKKMEKAQPVAPPEETSRAWISGKGIKSLRKRLGLSQADFAKLVEVSDQAVYMWEKKSGMLKLRGATKGKVLAVRGIGAREARKMLGEMPKATRNPKKQSKAKKQSKPKKAKKRPAAKRQKKNR